MTSTFGSELITLSIVVEKVIALIYKLRMFGIPLDGPIQAFCDNELVIKNRSYPESRLNKTDLSCIYHKIRELIAAGTIFLFFERGNRNLGDILTKSLKA